MKTFIGLLLSLVSSVGLAQSGASLLTNDSQSMGRHLMLRAQDCSKTYFVPTSYRIEKNLSSIVLFNGKSAEPVIRIEIVLAPDPEGPNGAEAAKAAHWAAGRGCPSEPNYTFAAYPSFFQDLSLKKHLADRAIPRVDTEFRSGGSKLIRIEILPREISLKALLEKLAAYRPELEIQKFRQVVDATVELAAEYSASAAFVQNHFVDRTCEETRKCDVFGGCRNRSHCTETPKITQTLQTATVKTGIVLRSLPGPGFPESKLASLENEIVSRFLMSIFVESSRIHIGDVSKVTFGELKKQASDRYFDRLTSERIDQAIHVEPIVMPSLRGFAKQELARIYEAGRFDLE